MIFYDNKPIDEQFHELIQSYNDEELEIILSSLTTQEIVIYTHLLSIAVDMLKDSKSVSDFTVFLQIQRLQKVQQEVKNKLKFITPQIYEALNMKLLQSFDKKRNEEFTEKVKHPTYL